MTSLGGDFGAAARSAARLTAVAVAFLTSACAKVAIQAEVPEREANETVAALLGAGLSAEKTPALAGEGTFAVEVDASDAARAFDVLREAGLPRPESTGFADLYAGERLVPTAAEERARLQAATSGELARSIERIDGVLEARVHLSLPERDVLDVDPAGAPPPRASVLVRYAGSAPPYNERAVQRLVAGGVPGLAEANVAVIGTRRVSAPRRPSDAAEAEAGTATSVSGPWHGVVGIHVAPSSVSTLRTMLGGLLGLVFALSACLVVLLLRRFPERRGARAEP